MGLVWVKYGFSTGSKKQTRVFQNRPVKFKGLSEIPDVLVLTRYF